jgi:hypothetical protein
MRDFGVKSRLIGAAYEGSNSRAPDQTPVKATRFAGGASRPALTGAGGTHA